MEDGPPRFPPGFTCPAVLGNILRRLLDFVYGAVTLYGRPFQDVRLSISFVTPRKASRPSRDVPQHPACNDCNLTHTRFRLHPRSLAATRGISVDFFSCGYLDVSVPRVCFNQPMYSADDDWIYQCRFADSEISGSKSVSDSPKLFAAAHVLLRLSMPRHPPCALSSLTVSLRHARSLRSRPRF